MLQEDEKFTKDNKVIDIDEKRKSNFMIFDSMAEEKQWMKRVEEECLRKCMEEVEK